MTKPEENTKVLAEAGAQEMCEVCLSFIQALNKEQRPKVRTNVSAVSNVVITLVPVHGAGKHSGVLCTFNVLDAVKVIC